MRQLLLIACLIAFCAGALGQARKPAANFDKDKFEAGINAAFEHHDAKAVGEFLAAFYNEGGVSKDLVVQQLSQLFKKSDVHVHYQISDFHQYPGTNLGYLKTYTEMSLAGSTPRTLHTLGYASMVNEGGTWRIVGTQAAACPRVNNFDFAAEKGDWSGWGSQLNPASIASSVLSPDDVPKFSTDFAATGSAPAAGHAFAATASLPKFDKEEWERRFVHAWNSKNAQEILGFYAKTYGEFGLDVTAVSKALDQTLAAYDKFDCKYRVLGIHYIPASDLASVKAVLDLRGVRKGATDLTPVLQVMGYASLVAQHGQWKIYQTQLFTAPEVGTLKFGDIKTEEWPPKLEVSVQR